MLGETHQLPQFVQITTQANSLFGLCKLYLAAAYTGYQLAEAL